MFNNLFNKNKEIQQPQHQPDFAIYMRETEDGPISILVDLALINHAPYKNFSTGLTLTLPYEIKRENGLPENDQLNELIGYEDVILGIAEKNIEHYHFSTVTNKGNRSICFYISDKSKTRNFLDEIKKEIGEKASDFYFNEYDDPNWESYIQGFYPLPFQLQEINNHRVVEQLKQSGDNSQKPREIFHFAFFNDEPKLQEYEDWLKQYEFKIIERKKLETGEIQLQFSRVDVPDYYVINDVCLPIWDKADLLGGKYDGWETSIEK